MRRHPEVFTAFYLAMVRVGEMTGRLEEVFLRLFDHLEFDRDMRERVKTAMRYPTFVIVAMVAAMVVVNVFVIPQFEKVFVSFHAELPMMTRILIGFRASRSRGGRRLPSRCWRGRPASGLDPHRARPAGVGPHQAAPADRRQDHPQGHHGPLRAQLRAVDPQRRADRAGPDGGVRRRRTTPTCRCASSRCATASNAARASCAPPPTPSVFTPIVLQMIAVGEESGSLDDLMDEIAMMYEREVDYELKTLSSQIEPILITFLGAMVLVLALGIFLPIWDLGKAALHNK